jgi:hypothetical protein
MLPPVPRRDSEYVKIWNRVVFALRAVGMVWARTFDRSVVNGQLKEELVGDHIHANERLTDNALRFLGYENHLSSDSYAWEYQFEIVGSGKI